MRMRCKACSGVANRLMCCVYFYISLSTETISHIYLYYKFLSLFKFILFFSLNNEFRWQRIFFP